ncbi:winged helix-turn-helix domain-containing protein [Raoultibacter massiliensis]|uniref:winged helix-turn-helix domain-containing protein n=1 Tax=Raoultibacter massiliensis TaxID=1852371 RepID=UPI003A8D6F12
MAGREPWFSMTQRELDLVCPQLNGSEWKVYTALASCRSSKTAETPPIGVSLIERKTGLGRRAVYYSAGRLEELGFVSRRKVGQRIVYGFPEA